MTRVTFRISGAAYQTIMDEAVSLRPDSRTTLKKAASRPDGWRVVDSTKEVSREIEDWFRRAADATPKRDASRIWMLQDAIRAIRDGRVKSHGEQR
jgi:TPP-dependent trihydroxycyclohexane-1,2-dione (THcHDO) dehydratase